MAIALLLARVDGLLAVLGDVPACLEVLALVLALFVQRLAHLGEDLVVCAALHREHLALVIVACRRKFVSWQRGVQFMRLVPRQT